MILVIPRHEVFVKFVEAPSVKPEELEKMAEFQAVKEIPHPKEDLVISCRNLGSYKEGFSSLMLIIATKDMVYEKIKEARLAGLRVEGIRLYTELLYLYLLKRSVIKQDKTVFVVDIGKEESEIMIIDRGRLIFSRGFKNSEKFLEEIDRSVLAYERDKDSPGIEDVIVSHASDIDVQEITPYIKEHFAVPVNFYEYGEDLAGVGLPAQIDLLPKEISHKKETLEKRQELALTYSLIGFMAILLFALLLFKVHEKNKILNNISLQIGQVQSRIEGLDNLVKKTEVARAHAEKGRFISVVLEEGYKSIPSDITISGMNYNGEDSVFYTGFSRDMSGILAFVKRLEGSKYFKKAEVKYATKKKIKGEEITDFNIQCWLNP